MTSSGAVDITLYNTTYNITFSWLSFVLLLERMSKFQD